MDIKYKKMQHLVLMIRLFILASLFVSTGAGATYNAASIMREADSQKMLFQVSGWSMVTEGHKAQSPLMWFSLIVGPKATVVTSPYINIKQKRDAQTRCEALASHILKPNNEQEIELANVIRRSTQFHMPRSIDMNGVRFDIAPTMEGVYVKLICTYSDIS